MTKDRIKELQNNTSWPNVSYRRLSRQFVSHEDQTEVDNEHRNSTVITIDHQSPVLDFLQETNFIRSDIDKINELAQQVKRIHVEMLQPSANPKLGQELDDKTEEIKKIAYEVSTRLKRMEQARENRDDHDQINAQWRIKESQIFVLTRRFRDTMTRYNLETVLHRERCKKAIVFQLEIAGHRKSNDELEEILENDFPGAFNFSMLVNTQRAKESLNQIEARHHDILKLENSMKELHNMFRDLAMLVADQGEMIDCIEHNVAKAVDYVEDAAEDVNIAENYHKKAIKKKIFILTFLLISVVLIFIVIIIGFFTQKKFRGR